jgi:hypothetical protein
MSRQLINRSWDLQKLQNEGYELEIKSGFLLVKGVPYVNSRKEVKRGTLVAKLVLAGDKTARPDDHVAYFVPTSAWKVWQPGSRLFRSSSIHFNHTACRCA